MSLNIKNPRAHELATRLAELTGESLTTAVIVSLEKRLRQEERQRQARDWTADDVLAFARRIRPHIDPALRSEDHATILYDEHGLPK